MALVKYNNNSLASVDDVSALDDAMVLIKTLTASSSATLSFVDGTSDVVLDNTYPIYKFVFTNIHPATNAAEFTFNLSADTGSNYNVSKTTTTFQSIHSEDNTTAASLAYDDEDLANGTGFQNLNASLGSDNDQSLSGSLRIFNPSDTTHVKHFIGETHISSHEDLALHFFIAGYFNDTDDITAMQFKMSSGNIDAGDICLYGIN